MTDDTDAIVLFDGVCNLCHASVRFILRHDWQKPSLRFAALQSDYGQRLIKKLSPPQPVPDSILVYTKGNLLSRSEAVLFIAGRLTYPWKLFCLLRIVPKQIRDWIYDWIAQHRYRFLGRQDSCPLLPPELHDRFLG